MCGNLAADDAREQPIRTSGVPAQELAGLLWAWRQSLAEPLGVPDKRLISARTRPRQPGQSEPVQVLPVATDVITLGTADPLAVAR